MSDPMYDAAAERALVSSLVLWPQNIADAIEVVAAREVYQPKLSAILAAAFTLHRVGSHVDAVTIADECRHQGRGDITVADIVDVTTSEGTSRWRAYADIVADKALRRRLALEARTLLDEAQDPMRSAIATLDKHKVNVAGIDTALVAGEPDDVSVEEFVERTTATPTPWVIHGLIRKGWRVMVVGPEGFGKSTLLRQIAECAAYGIHPFRLDRIDPQRVLVVDLENPEDALNESFSTILRKVQYRSGLDQAVNRLWWRPGGIDLRKRADRAELENLIAKRQPDLIVLGPLYKSYSVNAAEGFELPAREVMSAIDKLRERYGFSIIIEDHAPGENGGQRKMRPYGSSFWLRWPEIGIGLQPAPSDEHELILTRWRGDRAPSDWPTSIQRGTSWPWEGRWTEARESF